jgi:hypothetical protein
MFFFVPALCIIFCKRNVYFFGKKNSRNPIRHYYYSPVIKYRAFSPMGCTRKQSFDDTWYMSRQPDYKSLLQDNEKRNDYLSMSV